MKRNAVLLLAIAFATLALPPAGAGTFHADVSDVEIHCVAAATPDGGEDPGAVVPACFPTFAAAIFFATGGGVVLDEDFDASAITQDILSGAAESHIVVGIDYVDANYQGNTFTWTGHAECSATLGYSQSSMPAGWNDVISSAKAFANCNVYTHFEHSNFLGASVPCTCATMGVMNDQTSSERWRFA